MKISKADESALVIAIAENLQTGEISEWGYASAEDNWATKTLESLSVEGRRSIESIIDGSLDAFYQERVIHYLLSSGGALPDSGKSKIASFKEFKNPLDVSLKFVDFLKSSPHPY